MHSDRSRCRAIDGHCLIWRARQREQRWDNFIFSRSPPAPAATDNIIASEHFSRCTPSSCSVSTSSGCISTAPYISIPPFSSIDSFPFLSLLLHLIQALTLSACLCLDQCLSHRFLISFSSSPPFLPSEACPQIHLFPPPQYARVRWIIAFQL